MMPHGFWIVYILASAVLIAHGAYDDALARYKMLPMAAAAYSKRPGECVTNVFGNATSYARTIFARRS